MNVWLYWIYPKIPTFCHKFLHFSYISPTLISLKLLFLFLNENIRSGPSIELSQRHGSNDGSQNTFSWSTVLTALHGPEVIKLFFMLNQVEHEIFPVHKC